ncbi:MAG: 6-aminohexanoate hydrolase, partial [Eudoraea sp.]|nr:6-aminohexanoate hydrolase [Eudoraea sp.]NNK30985.1 6-aminohexanoate hydrolase [Flavobacteriaceae bacterium]
MKKLVFNYLFLILAIHYNMQGQDYISSEESNPVKMGWMQGFPPSKDKIVSAIDGSFFKFPALRYSVCHMREFMPTTEVKAATANRYTFKTRLDNAIDKVTFLPTKSSKPMTWRESLAKNYTDGM